MQAAAAVCIQIKRANPILMRGNVSRDGRYFSENPVDTYCFIRFRDALNGNQPMKPYYDRNHKQLRVPRYKHPEIKPDFQGQLRQNPRWW